MEINYVLPDGTKHRYIPDYYVEMRTRDGRVKKFLVEVKPQKQDPYSSPPPKEPKNKTAKAMRNYRKALRTYMTNACKFEAAEKWCKKRGIKFIVYTEVHAAGAFSGR